jgi:hypothetical protein
VPGDWMEGREYSAAGSDLSVGDLVVVPRTDGTLRFGEVVSIDASRICQVHVFHACIRNFLARRCSSMAARLLVWIG